MSNTFVPRFTADGIYENPYWYAYNPYPDLPNCTCYAWGRFYEILGDAPLLQLGNAKDWFPKTVLYGPYETGDKPHIGAVVCFDSKKGDGHVAVVEQVNEDGTFIVSQSGFRRPIYDYPPDTPGYFTLDYFNIRGMPNEFQGFIYNPACGKVNLDIPAWMLFKFRKGAFTRW